MRLKSQRVKHIAILLAAQLGCVAIGMWIHHRLVVSAVARAVRTQAVNELASDAAGLLAVVDEKAQQTKGTSGDQISAVQESLQSRTLTPGITWALVDNQWRVIASGSGVDGEAADIQSGQMLPWEQPAETNHDVSNHLAGLVTLGGTSHVAVAHGLRGGEGYLVTYRPIGETAVVPRVLLDSLPAAGIIALTWISTLLAIIVCMVLSRLHDQTDSRRVQSDTEALKRIQSLARTRDAVIVGLAKLAESRDSSTGHHLERIAAYSYRLATAVHQHPKYQDAVKLEFVQIIGISSALHDIGKVGIEDRILLKRGPLTDEERERMKKHTVIGERCLLEIERRLGTSNFLQIARQIAVAHHERWDGDGYPHGLIGREIPLAARIVAIADVYDALSSRRAYKEPIPHDKCVDMIRREAGEHFDPDLVDVFLKIEDSLRPIAELYIHEDNAGQETPSNGIPLFDELLAEEGTLQEETLEESLAAAADSSNFT